MDNENEQAQVEQETVEQEETTQEEQPETVSIPKEKFTHMQRKAMAYDAMKKSPKPLVAKEEPNNEIAQKVNRLEEIENKRQFGFEHQLSPEETDYVFKISGGKPSKEVLEDPFVKAGIDGYRSKKRLENNTPSSSPSSSPFRGKQFSEMSEDDKKKTFEEKSPLARH